MEEKMSINYNWKGNVHSYMRTHIIYVILYICIMYIHTSQYTVPSRGSDFCCLKIIKKFIWILYCWSFKWFAFAEFCWFIVDFLLVLYVPIWWTLFFYYISCMPRVQSLRVIIFSRNWWKKLFIKTYTFFKIFL